MKRIIFVIIVSINIITASESSSTDELTLKVERFVPNINFEFEHKVSLAEMHFIRVYDQKNGWTKVHLTEKKDVKDSCGDRVAIDTQWIEKKLKAKESMTEGGVFIDQNGVRYCHRKPGYFFVEYPSQENK